MTISLRSFWIIALIVLVKAEAAFAGMPVVRLDDLARMRIQSVSFFLFGFVVSAWLVRLCWNTLSSDFPKLPRLSFGRALGVVTLWGLLFVLVLTMISGARELMTPGAWEQQGWTYKLAEGSATGQGGEVDRRQAAIDRLRVALWTYAGSHDGRFPNDIDTSGIPEDAWLVPDPSGLRYRYLGGLRLNEGASPLAFEPGLFGADRLVLLTDGTILRMTAEEIRRALAEGEAE